MKEQIHENMADDFREILTDRHGEDVERQLKASADVFDKRGYELPDPVPTAPPVGFYNEESSLSRFVRELVLSEQLKFEARRQAAGTFEEEDDFDEEDDTPVSDYELDGRAPRPDLDEAVLEVEREAAQLAQDDAAEGAGEAEPPKRQAKRSAVSATPKAKPSPRKAQNVAFPEEDDATLALRPPPFD